MARYRGRPRNPRLNRRREPRREIFKVLIQTIVFLFELVVAMYQAPW